MAHHSIHIIAILGAIALAGTASAATTLLPGGDIRLAAGWDNGLPAPGNDATISVDGILGDSDTFGFGAGTIINHTTGTIDALPFVGASRTGFNLNGGGTWNMSGGAIASRYILSNGGGTIFNLSGGLLQLVDVEGTQHMGAANGGTWNVSGSVVIDGTFATVEVQTANAFVDIASGWTGSWTWGPYPGTEWRDHFTNGDITVDGSPIDGATFDSTFTVTNGGQTLSMIPEPGTAMLIGLLLPLGFLGRRRK